ncbi:MAG TPA: glycerol-3-phosphate 1-O-acyltransferase PlsY [Terriglobales bacterium]
MDHILLSAGMGYLLGSIPFGYLLVRIFHGEDIRRTGSGNIGATNVSRTSLTLGVITLLFDASKGLAAVLLARFLFPGNITAAAAAALFAVVGHVYPAWLKFRGGKGVATGLGSFILLAPKSVVICVAIFLAIAALFRYVSLASMVAVALLPVLIFALSPRTPEFELVALLAAVLILVQHRGNMGRLLSGVEPRFRAGHGAR